MRRFLLLLVAVVMWYAGTSQQLHRVPRPLRVMAWNVENLFDTVHDVGFADEEFLPTAERHWNSHRYWQKLTELSKVIAAIGEEGGLPDLIGLCEVENDSVLTMLTRRCVLRELGYDYVMTRGIDHRGIDVALLFQPARFRLLDSKSIRIPSLENGLRPTRDILYAKGLVRTASEPDTLHVLVVHLPSRAGGHEGDQNRSMAAQTLWECIDSIQTAPHESSVNKKEESKKNIILLGDFNATANDQIFRDAPLLLTDDMKEGGTYCYQGYWQWIDHILISSRIEAIGPARPLRFPWLLEANRTYGGDMPRRTYRGPTYHGGISDHLPLLLDLNIH